MALIDNPTAEHTMDPSAERTFGWNWSSDLSRSSNPDTAVSASTWTVNDSELVIEDDGFTAIETWVTISHDPDIDGVDYDLRNFVTFSNGERDVATWRIRIRKQ
jgi:hypothetical protein